MCRVCCARRHHKFVHLREYTKATESFKGKWTAEVNSKKDYCQRLNKTNE